MTVVSSLTNYISFDDPPDDKVPKNLEEPSITVSVWNVVCKMSLDEMPSIFSSSYVLYTKGQKNGGHFVQGHFFKNILE